MNIEFIQMHTSGHADLDAMRKLNEVVNPNYTIIIHTENSKKGKEIFNNVIELKDGEIYN